MSNISMKMTKFRGITKNTGKVSKVALESFFQAGLIKRLLMERYPFLTHSPFL